MRGKTSSTLDLETPISEQLEKVLDSDLREELTQEYLVIQYAKGKTPNYDFFEKLARGATPPVAPAPFIEATDPIDATTTHNEVLDAFDAGTVINEDRESRCSAKGKLEEYWLELQAKEIENTIEIEVFNLRKIQSMKSSSVIEKKENDDEKFDAATQNYGKRKFMVYQSDEILSSIAAAAPNFPDILQHLHAPLSICAHTKKPVRIPPILLVGAPGVGKTRAARKIGELLNPDNVIFHGFTSSEAGAALGGMDRSWSTSSTGKVFNALASGSRANPVFILDEIDKIAVAHTSKGQAMDPTAELLQLLEQETARRFTDKGINIEFDASYVTYIATANSLAGIPKALLSRFIIVLSKNPDAAQAVSIVESITSDICDLYDVKIKTPRGAIMSLLADKNPRTIFKIVSAAVVFPICEGRDHFSMLDIEKAMNLILGVPISAKKRQLLH